MKNNIIKSSQELFLHFGYSKVTTGDIAEKAGISKKTLYNYFSSKEELMDEVVEHLLSNLRTELEQLLMKEIEFDSKLKEVVNVVSQTLAKLNNHFLEDIRRKLPKTWFNLVYHKDEIVKRYFGKLIDEGMASGYVRKDVNKDIALLMMIISIEYLFDPSFLKNLPRDVFPKVPNTARETFNMILNIMYNGILTKEIRTS